MNAFIFLAQTPAATPLADLAATAASATPTPTPMPAVTPITIPSGAIPWAFGLLKLGLRPASRCLRRPGAAFASCEPAARPPATVRRARKVIPAPGLAFRRPAPALAATDRPSGFPKISLLATGTLKFYVQSHNRAGDRPKSEAASLNRG